MTGMSVKRNRRLRAMKAEFICRLASRVLGVETQANSVAVTAIDMDQCADSDGLLVCIPAFAGFTAVRQLEGSPGARLMETQSDSGPRPARNEG